MSSSSTLLTSLLVSLTLAACGGGGSTAEGTLNAPSVPPANGIAVGEPTAVELRMTRLEAGDRAAVITAWPQQRYVVQSEAEWSSAWNERTFDRECNNAYFPCATLKRPEIDFRTYTLVGLALGDRPAGWVVSIEKVVQLNSEVTVYYRDEPPAPCDCVYPAVQLPTSQFVLVPHLEQNFKFEKLPPKS